MSKPREKGRKIKSNTYYVLPNADKTLHQQWGDENHDRNNLLNIPRPYSMLLTAQPNCGKSCLIKNMLIQMKPTPQNIFIMHAETWDENKISNKVMNERNEEDFLNKDIDEISEYRGIKAVYFKRFPPIQFWDQFKNCHNLLIIDDVNLKQWAGSSRERLNIIDKTWSWCRTHRNLTIISAFQSIYQQALPSIYRFSNVFVIWKIRDKFVQSMLSRVCGIDKKEWDAMFSLCQNSHDNICIDVTNDTPAPFRFNLVNPIRCKEDEDLSDSSSESE
jgi:hypothetical protein